MIRVLIVDDHRIFRQGLHALLKPSRDIEIIGEARDGAQALELVEGLQPDVILMDIEMPGMDGLEATEHLISAGTHAKILMLSMRTEEKDVRAAAQNGARGFLVKNCSREELADAIRSVNQGGTPCSPEIAPFFSR